jgi:hypothetical protein
LKENKDENELVDDADRESEPPECRVRPQERPVRHDGHSYRHPEEQGRQKAPTAVVLGVVLDRVLDDPDVDEAADEEEEDCEGVGAPEERHAPVVIVHPLFLLRPDRLLQEALNFEGAVTLIRTSLPLMTQSVIMHCRTVMLCFYM